MNTAMEWNRSCTGGQAEQEWNAWFATPGDADDFIFYWEENPLPSEK